MAQAQKADLFSADNLAAAAQNVAEKLKQRQIKEAVAADFVDVLKIARGVVETKINNFANEPARPPAPIPEKFKVEIVGTSLERDLETALQRLNPETLRSGHLNFIDDLANARVTISCPRSDFSERQKKFIWEPIVRAWWQKLSSEQRTKFAAVAKAQLKNNEIKAERSRAQETQFAAWRKILERWSLAERLKLFLAVQQKQTINCPAGFSEDQCNGWRDFVVNQWVADMPAAEKLFFENKIKGQAELKHQQARLRERLTKLAAKRKSLGSLGNKVSSWFSRANQEKTAALQAEYDAVEREYHLITYELRGAESEEWVQELIDRADEKLRLVGERTGWGEKILNSVRSLFNQPVEEAGKIRATREGEIYAALSGFGSLENKLADRAPLLNAAEQAARDMRSGNSIKNQPVKQTSEIDNVNKRIQRVKGETGESDEDPLKYLLEVERQVTAELTTALQEGVTVRRALTREPLAGLLKAYRVALDRVISVDGLNTIQAVAFLDQKISLAERSLVDQLRRAPTKKLLRPTDKKYIATLFERAVEAAARPEPKLPPSVLPSTERLDVARRTEFVVKAGDKIEQALWHFLKVLHPNLSTAERNKAMLFFMKVGTVTDSAGLFGNKIVEKGVVTGSVGVGDKIIAQEDAAEPYGFKIEIERANAERRPGYFVYGAAGEPARYYEKRTHDIVDVWRFDERGAPHLSGWFEKGAWLPYAEKSFKYTKPDGTTDSTSEFEQNIYFVPDGQVVSVAVGKNNLKINLVPLGRQTALPKTVQIETLSGQRESIELNNSKHLLTPRGHLLERDDLFGLRDIGVVQSS